MTVTRLGEAAGIQYSGFTGSEELNPNAMSYALFIGVFKRGRTDKPFLVTRDNIRAKLGYDPKNPAYIAVQDALDVDGVASVYVLRVGEVGADCCESWVEVECDCDNPENTLISIDCDC